MNWISIESALPPHDEIVLTRVEGKNNEQMLRRRGNLFFHPDNLMYIYYSPTHWRPLTTVELGRLEATLEYHRKMAELY